jgi:AraC-like DNA-binding protein
MYKMHMFRDGALPVAQQIWHTARLDVLRYDCWVLQVWNHANLAAPYWRLYWNQEAGAEIRLGETRYDLTPECLFLIAPNTPFVTRYSGDGRPAREENVMIGCPVAEWEPRPGAGRRVVRHLFVHFLAGAPFDAAAPRIFALPLTAPVRELIAGVLPPIAAGHGSLNRQESLTLHAVLAWALAQVPETVWPSAQTDARVVAAIRFLEDHLAEPLTNADFSSLAAMSAKAFVRLFKAHTGQTPLAYLQRKRLETASILLHHTDESIEGIAAQCGFYDRHHFSKIFQRTFGVGPATYRKVRMP